MLLSPQVSVERAWVCNELVVVPPLHHLAALQHQDLISVNNSRETMSNVYGRLPFGHSLHCIHDILEKGGEKHTNVIVHTIIKRMSLKGGYIE